MSGADSGGRVRARSVSRFASDGADQCRHFDTLFRAQAFDVLIEEAQAEIRRVVSRFRGLTREDREDAVQQTCAHLLAEWRCGKTYGRHAVLTVIRMRAGWVVREHAARVIQVRDNEMPAGAWGADLGEDHGGAREHPAWTDENLSPAECALDGEVAAAALAGLTDKERKVAWLRCFMGMSSAQVADRLDMLPNAVDQTYFRARQKMRESLQSYWGTSPG